jgi:site-specific DNA-cytosine methylase
MEATGYAFGAADLCAAGVGAPHIRQRLWFVGERLDDTTGVLCKCRPDWERPVAAGQVFLADLKTFAERLDRPGRP